jgi:type IX secretion system PorP/SprF family membrane protein
MNMNCEALNHTNEKKINPMIKKLIIILAFAFTSKVNNAQDFHLSQFDQAPQYLNPALTGVFFGENFDYRLGMNFRSQWKSILPKSYSTTSLGYDMNLTGKYEKFGIGGFIISNNAVAGNFKTFTMMLGGSYQVMEKNSPHSLTTGLQLGFMNLSTPTNDYTYDQQYSGTAEGGFDSSLPNGENFNNQSLFRFDGNLGVHYKYLEKSSDWKPFGGLSLYHIMRPKESFTGQNVKIPIRWNFNIGTDYKIDDKWMITPNILFMTQAKATDFNIGVMAGYNFSSKSDVTYRGLFGASYRSKDAVIIHAGINKANQILRLSYDINVSSLKTYTQGKGAFEISLLLTARRGEPIFKGIASF